MLGQGAPEQVPASGPVLGPNKALSKTCLIRSGLTTPSPDEMTMATADDGDLAPVRAEDRHDAADGRARDRALVLLGQRGGEEVTVTTHASQDTGER